MMTRRVRSIRCCCNIFFICTYIGWNVPVMNRSGAFTISVVRCCRGYRYTSRPCRCASAASSRPVHPSTRYWYSCTCWPCCSASRALIRSRARSAASRSPSVVAPAISASMALSFRVNLSSSSMVGEVLRHHARARKPGNGPSARLPRAALRSHTARARPWTGSRPHPPPSGPRRRCRATGRLPRPAR